MIKEIFEHRSVRSFEDRAIEQAVLDDILLAGVRASNTGNMQIYSIVVTTDTALKTELAPCHFNQPMVSQAAAVLTFCADVHRFARWCTLRGAVPEYDNFVWFINGVIDSVLASQNVLLEAEHHGIGGCYLGTTTYTADKIIEVLKLPAGVVPVTTLVLGYPAGKTQLTDRLPLRAVVHNQTYNEYSDNDLEELWSEREGSEETAELLKTNNLPNLAQIFTLNRYKGVDNRLFSQKYFETLKKQGFFNQ